MGYIVSIGVAAAGTAAVCGWTGTGGGDAERYDALLGCELPPPEADPLAELRIDARFAGAQVDEVLRGLGELIGQAVVGDFDRLSRIGVTEGDRIWLVLPDTPAATVLELLPGHLGDDVVVERENGRIVVTVRPNGDEGIRRTPATLRCDYDVRRLVTMAIAREREEQPFEGNWFTDRMGVTNRSGHMLFDESDDSALDERIATVMDLLRSTVDPDNWVQNGGLVNRMSEFGGVLSAEATSATHRRIAALLHAVHAAQHGEGPDPADLAMYDRTMRRLEKPITIDAEGAQLDAVMAAIRRQVDVAIDLPMAGLRGVSADTEVTLHAKDRPAIEVLGEAVGQMFGDRDARRLVSRAVRADGIVALGGVVDEPATTLVRAYPLGDLVARSAWEPYAVDDDDVSERMERLMTTLRETIEPDAWRQAGGMAAMMMAFDTAMVIDASPMVHAEVEQRLAGHRRLRARYAGP